MPVPRHDSSTLRPTLRRCRLRLLQRIRPHSRLFQRRGRCLQLGGNTLELCTNALPVCRERPCLLSARVCVVACLLQRRSECLHQALQDSSRRGELRISIRKLHSRLVSLASEQLDSLPQLPNVAGCFSVSGGALKALKLLIEVSDSGCRCLLVPVKRLDQNVLAVELCLGLSRPAIRLLGTGTQLLHGGLAQLMLRAQRGMRLFERRVHRFQRGVLDGERLCLLLARPLLLLQHRALIHRRHRLLLHLPHRESRTLELRLQLGLATALSVPLSARPRLATGRGGASAALRSE